MSKTQLNPEAVEAASRAIYHRDWAYKVEHRAERTPWSELAQAALTVALPHIEKEMVPGLRPNVLVRRRTTTT